VPQHARGRDRPPLCAAPARRGLRIAGRNARAPACQCVGSGCAALVGACSLQAAAAPHPVAWRGGVAACHWHAD
jgi:hypothetical protein